MAALVLGVVAVVGALSIMDLMRQENRAVQMTRNLRELEQEPSIELRSDHRMKRPTQEFVSKVLAAPGNNAGLKLAAQRQQWESGMQGLLVRSNKSGATYLVGRIPPPM